MSKLDRRTVLIGGAAAGVLAVTATTVMPGWASTNSPIGADTPVEPATFTSPGWRALPLMDRQLFTVLSQIVATFRRHAGTIWGDYRPDRSQMVCAHWPDGGDSPDYAYVLNARRPMLTGDAQAVELPRSLGLGAVYRITRGAGMDAATSPNGIIGSADVAGEPTLIVGFTPTRGMRAVLSFGTWLDARVLVHEAFHIHQSTWTPYPGAQPRPMEYPREAENAALVLLEDAVLALPPGQPASTAAETLRTYLAIRATRVAGLPEVGWRDGWYQQMEGTARFAENRYVRSSGHQLADLSKDLTTGFALLDWIGRSRGYSAGMSCGELLESAAGPRWRTRSAQEGQAPAEIAAAILGVPAPDHRDRLVAAAKETFDYPRLLDMVRRADLPSVVGPE